MTSPAQKFAGYSSAILALLLALGTAYITMDRHINALAAGAITPEKVEHIIDLKTVAKLDEIIRRLARIEGQLDDHTRIRAHREKEL